MVTKNFTIFEWSWKWLNSTYSKIDDHRFESPDIRSVVDALSTSKRDVSANVELEQLLAICLKQSKMYPIKFVFFQTGKESSECKVMKKSYWSDFKDSCLVWENSLIRTLEFPCILLVLVGVLILKNLQNCQVINKRFYSSASNLAWAFGIWTGLVTWFSTSRCLGFHIFIFIHINWSIYRQSPIFSLVTKNTF